MRDDRPNAPPDRVDDSSSVADHKASRAQSYVHGYSTREARRLDDQANSVRDLIHHDTSFPDRSLVLEVACGVGAQTVAIAKQNPQAKFVSFDVAVPSLQLTAQRIRAHDVTNVRLFAADLFAMPLRPGTVDHLFVSYVLEHMRDPLAALRTLFPLLRPGGTVTVVEGDHGSCYFHPSSPAARAAWQCLIDVQAQLGADSLVGRRLYPLLSESGFSDVSVSPRMVYADRSRPATMDAFVARTIVPMVEGVRDRALTRHLIGIDEWEAGLADLRSIASSPDGTFCYTFFKAVGRKPVDLR